MKRLINFGLFAPLLAFALPASAQYTRFKTGKFPGNPSLSTVGYRLLPKSGAAGTRVTANIAETLAGVSCEYGVDVTFPAGFAGTILWDTGAGTTPTFYASEVVNPGGNVEALPNMAAGAAGGLPKLNASSGLLDANLPSNTWSKADAGLLFTARLLRRQPA